MLAELLLLLLRGSLPLDLDLLKLAEEAGPTDDLLLVDEPSLGLAPQVIRGVFKALDILHKEKGLTILLVEHNMKLVMDVADEIIVLDFGRKLAEGNCDEISSNRKVIEAYLGSDYMKLAGGNDPG